MQLDSTSKEDITKIDPTHKDGDKLEEGKAESKLEVMQVVTNCTNLEDFLIRSIAAHSIEKECLYLLVELDSREFLLVSYNQLKKDFPLILARYAKEYNIERVHEK